MELVVGACIAVLIPIIIEALRKPRLELTIAAAADAEYPEKTPARKVRFLHVDVENKPLRLMSRNTAIQCHGSITFHNLDGQRFFEKSMPIRWVGPGQPEPTLVPIIADGKNIGGIPDLRFSLAPKVDIAPGEKEPLGVAARFDNDNDCFGWSNDNYFSDPPWRNQTWKLRPGCYLVKINVVCAGVPTVTVQNRTLRAVVRTP